MELTEKRDELIYGTMTEFANSRGRRLICDELTKLHEKVRAELLEVREGQDKAIYTKDQLLKRELHYLEYLGNLPNTLVVTTTTHTQDLSKML